MCGGTPATPTVLLAAVGLSPRVRGNHGTYQQPLEGWGSIPACAGEPTTVELRRKTLMVYPRVCGGTADYPPVLALRNGLSPRVRGNRRARAPLRDWLGSIPACAGEPVTAPLIAVSWPVYPRVCGGTRTSCAPIWQIQGLSPRVRGNRRHCE